MRTWAMVALFGIAVGATAVACSDGSADPPTCTNQIGAHKVVMDDFSYQPSCAALNAGTRFGLLNRGAAPHTFTLEHTEIDILVDAGERTSVDLRDVAPGEYTVSCKYHPQMVAIARIVAGD